MLSIDSSSDASKEKLQPTFAPELRASITKRTGMKCGLQGSKTIILQHMEQGLIPELRVYKRRRQRYKAHRLSCVVEAPVRG